MKLHLVLFNTVSNFGQNGYYDSSIERLKETFLKNGGDEIHHYTEENIPLTEEQREYCEEYRDRSFGYYSFKPVIILDTLKKIEFGDVVLYHDAGRPGYNYEFTSDLKFLASKAKKYHQGLGIGHGHWRHIEYTKDYCFKEMKCDTDYIRSKFQLAANWGFYEKNPKVVNFVKDWKKWCFNHKVIVTAEPDEINHKEFASHRWDQSILTNLFYLYSFRPFPFNGGWEKNINIFTKSYIDANSPIQYINKQGEVLVYDISYSNNKLRVVVPKSVTSVKLFNNIEPSIIEESSNKKFNVVLFDIEFTQYIELQIETTKGQVDRKYTQFILTK